MIPARELEDELENRGPALVLLPGLITAGTLLVAFTLLAVGFEQFWVTFVVGFGVVLPTAVGRSLSASRTRPRHTRWNSRTDKPSGNQEDDAALAALRRRYARGELSDAEFERRVERLLETEPRDDERFSAGFGRD